ncbi:MAG: PspC domain-containing protein [Actinomycetia bacterium]|nr:PspC domain-containing protein [Actinomycetes bacterium]
MVAVTAQTTPSPSAAGAPRLRRSGSERVFGGVAGGIAEHLGLSPALVRVAFVLLAAAAGLGVTLYAAFWIVLPVAPDAPPGRVPAWLGYPVAAIVGVGSLAAVARTTSLGRWLVPATLGAVGAALIWRQADDAQRQRWVQWSRSPGVLGGRGRFGSARLAIGVALVAGGAAAIFFQVNVPAASEGVLAGAVTLVGVALITGPWWLRLVEERNTERRERIRSQARADLAAHLHDSVLQTLALIQRNADSPREVARLARGQERELRELLYGPPQATGQLSQALRATAGEVEDAYAVSVDVVVVGDSAITENLVALVAACREALVNAAKHAGVTTVSLYAEVEDDVVTGYVKDRGVGFDLAEIAPDRQGVRGSLLGRVERHGGEVQVRTAKGSGTEIEIRMPIR